MVNVEAFESVQIASVATNRVVKQKDGDILNKDREKRISEIMNFLGSQLPIQHMTISD